MEKNKKIGREFYKWMERGILTKNNESYVDEYEIFIQKFISSFSEITEQELRDMYYCVDNEGQSTRTLEYEDKFELMFYKDIPNNLYVMAKSYGKISIEQKKKISRMVLVNRLANYNCSPSIKQMCSYYDGPTALYLHRMIIDGYLTYELIFKNISRGNLKNICLAMGNIGNDLAKQKKEELVDYIVCNTSAIDEDLLLSIIKKYPESVKIKPSSKALDEYNTNNAIFSYGIDDRIKHEVLQHPAEQSYNKSIFNYFFSYIHKCEDYKCYYDLICRLLEHEKRDRCLGENLYQKFALLGLYIYLNGYVSNVFLKNLCNDLRNERDTKKRAQLLTFTLRKYLLTEYSNGFSVYRVIKLLRDDEIKDLGAIVDSLYDSEYPIRLFTPEEYKKIYYEIIDNGIGSVNLYYKIYDKFYNAMLEILDIWGISICLDDYKYEPEGHFLYTRKDKAIYNLYKKCYKYNKW